MFRKLLLWSCLLLFGATALSYESTFTAGRVYHYHYDAQLSHGLVGRDEAALSRMQAVLKLEFMNHEEAQVDVDIVKFASAQVVERKFIDEIIAFDHCEEFQVNDERLAEIKCPFFISLEKGLITQIQFGKDESVWSRNMKKAMMNLLQVQVSNGSGQLEAVTEKTVEGECEVLYSVYLDEGKELTNITKSVNFDKCRNRPVVRYDAQTPISSAPCKRSHRSLVPFTSTVYNFVIEDLQHSPAQHKISNRVVTVATVRSEYVDSDATFTDTAFKSVSLGELKLVKSTPVHGTRRQDVRWEQPETLIYNTTGWIAEEDVSIRGFTSKTVESPFITENRVQMLIDTFNTLYEQVKRSEDAIDGSAAFMVQKAVELLPYLQINELQQVKAAVLSSQTYKQDDLKIRINLFADLLITTGDHNSVQMYASMLTAHEIPASKTMQNLPQFLNSRVVSEVTVSTVHMICQSASIKSNRYNYNTCILTWSALLNRLCNEKDNHASVNMERVHCTSAKKMEYIEGIMRMYQGASERYERMVLLKVLGNLGFAEVYNKVKHIVVNPSESVSMRGQAINSLRLLSNKLPSEIRELLVPMVLNQKEYSTLRINALYQVMLTTPCADVVNMLTSALTSDPSTEVKAFMASALRIFGETNTCCGEELSKRMQASMEIMKSKTVNWLDYNFIRKMTFDVAAVKGTMNLMTLFGKANMIPNLAISGLDLTTRGETFMNEYAIGIEQENLDVLVENLEKYWKTHEINELFVRGQRSSWNPLELLKSVMRKLGITGRTPSSSNRAPLVAVHLRYRNFDTGYIQLSRSNAVPEVFNELLTTDNHINLKVISDLLKENQEVQRYQITNLRDVVIKIPTVFGVDLKMSSKMPIVINMAGLVDHSFKSHVATLKSDVTLKIVGNSFNAAETWSPIFSAGVLQGQVASAAVPLVGNAELSLKPTVSFKINIHVPTQEMHLLKVYGGVTRFVRKIPQSQSEVVQENEKMINVFDRDDYTETVKEFICPFTGLKYVTDAQYARHMVSDFSSALSGDNMLTITIKPTSTLSQYTTFSIEWSKKVKSVSKRPQLYDLLSGQTRILDGIEDSDVQIMKKEISDVVSKEGTEYKLTAQLSNANNQRMWLDLQHMCITNRQFCTTEMIAKQNFRRELTIFNVTFQNFVTDADQVSKEKMALTTLQVQGSDPRMNVAMVKALSKIPLRIHSPSTAFDLDYQMQTAVKERFVSFALYLRNLLLNQADVSLPSDAPLVNHNILYGNVTYYPKTEITIKSSDNDTQITVPLSTNVEKHRPRSMASCDVESKQISTFDGVTYDYELGTCFSVIAKDCSKRAAPRFVVLARKMSSRGPIQVRIVTEHKEMRMYIDSERRLVTKINDEEVQANRLARSTKDSMYIIDLETQDVQVQLGRNQLIVSLARKYKELQCGLCGHYNGDASDVFRTARNVLTEDIDEFTNSFILRDECDLHDKHETIYESNPMKAHIIVEYRHTICFTKQMWDKCMEGEKATRSLKRTVDLACIPRSEHSVVHKMKHLAKHGRPLDFNDVDYVESHHQIDIPIGCQ